MKTESPAKTIVLFAAGTLVAAAAATLIVRLLGEAKFEHLARLAAGESDFEHTHPREEDRS